MYDSYPDRGKSGPVWPFLLLVILPVTIAVLLVLNLLLFALKHLFKKIVWKRGMRVARNLNKIVWRFLSVIATLFLSLFLISVTIYASVVLLFYNIGLVAISPLIFLFWLLWVIVITAKKEKGAQGSIATRVSMHWPKFILMAKQMSLFPAFGWCLNKDLKWLDGTSIMSLFENKE